MIKAMAKGFEKMDPQIKSRGGRRPGSGRKPGTPNKSTADLRSLAQVHSAAAVARLAHLMTHAASEQAQIAAAKELLDRAHGRPAQSVEAHVNSEQHFATALAAMLNGTGRGLPSEGEIKDGELFWS